MRYLLDTHTFLWWMAEPERLSDQVTRIMRNQPGQVAFSVVSAWEIAIKTSIGKLEGVPIDELEDTVAAQGWHELPFRMRHAPIMSGLPFLHHDPFDRALIAQALAEDLILLSKDENIARYSAPVIW